MTDAPPTPKRPMTHSKTGTSDLNGVKPQAETPEHGLPQDGTVPLAASSFKPRRRHVVQGLGSGVAALSLGGMTTQAAEATPSAQPDAATPPPQPTTASARFFTAAEFAFLVAACERLFPEDDLGPGAITLGVPDFIDGQMNTPWGRGEKWFMSGPHRSGPANLGYQLPYSPQQLYRKGIAGTQAWVRQHHNAPFESLPPPTQDDILTALEQNATVFDDLPASAFFEQLRSDTIEGAFADPIHKGNRHMGGWKMMGFPGARADYMDWVDRYETPYPYGPVSISGETG